MGIRSLHYPGFEAVLRDYRDGCEVLPGLPTATTYDEVLYTPAARTGGDPPFRGGLFDRDGRRIEAADLTREHATLNTAQPAPAESRIEGHGIYLGWSTLHYGNALLEGLSRTWLEGEHDFAVFHAPRQRIPAFLQAHLDRLGAPTAVFPSTPTRFERLTVPYPAFELNARAFRGFLRSFPRLDRSDSRPLYVSRSRLPLDRRAVIGEDVLERSLSGYRIVHPETMSLAEQIQAFSAHPRIAGTLGSAMHNILFSRSPDVVYLTNRSRHRSYMLCDDLVEADSLYVGCCDYGDLPGLGRSGPLRLDLARAADALGVTIDPALQRDVDRRYNQAWAEFRLRQGVAQRDRSALADVRRHYSGPLAPRLLALARRLAAPSTPASIRTGVEVGAPRWRQVSRKVRARVERDGK